MLIRRSSTGDSITIECPAKLNLVLEVLGKRPDGYHQVSTVMCPITLWDQVHLTPRSDGLVSLEVVVPVEARLDDPAWQIPRDERNLVVQAAKLVKRRLVTSAGCHIRLTKSTPAAAGLGGGSSNAAATIAGCLLLWSKWDRNAAEALGKQLGSDVSFFFGSHDGFGMMLAEGRGEQTSLIAYQPPLAFWVTHPPIGCSTGEVYSRVRQFEKLGKTEEFLAACETGQESKIGAALFNALQLPACQLNNWIELQLSLLATCGSQYVLMSGSGSSCYGLVPRQGMLAEVKSKAQELGIQRVYQTQAWYGPSIEQQLDI
ncbi:MAG: 4-(cytidine 5'-diphospho)-2-C-methyl-D-erythritol kinase [Pirellulaceae bacterium]|nr:4-(cytidine 5'-diphospho)-2-C-methyl-D-erythritol kinase [Pirellulaceae bacterium]